MFTKKEQEQLELFEELKKSSTKRFKRSKLPFMRKEEKKILFEASYEKIVLTGIAFVLILILVFSLGVKRGKIFKQAGLEKEKISAVEVSSKKEASIEKQEKKKAETRKIKENKEKSEFYTIQVVAYKDSKKAGAERKKIETTGLQSFTVSGNKGWVLLCVGSFTDISLAKKELLALKKVYGDCFIKKVKREDILYE